MYITFSGTFLPVHGSWSQWNPWTVCDKPCGGGLQKRIRVCDRPKPEFGGRMCECPNGEVAMEEEVGRVCNVNQSCIRELIIH